MTAAPAGRKTMEKRGFTLVELLVVTLIMGVLAVVAMPQYFKFMERSRVAEAHSLFGTIRASQTRVVSKQGLFTDRWEGLDVVFADSAGKPCAGPDPCVMKTFSFLLDRDGTIYATRNPRPAAPKEYGEYTLLHDINSGSTTCTDPKCIMDLL